jgi:hypothetical protein
MVFQGILLDGLFHESWIWEPGIYLIRDRKSTRCDRKSRNGLWALQAFLIGYP